MEKVVITQEQADRIREWETHAGYLSKLLELHSKYSLSRSKCLQDLTLDELARALYVGYKVEEEFEHWNWVYILETGEVGRVDRNYSGIGFVDVYDHNYYTKGYKPNEIRHATESEIAEEEKRRTNKKLDEILLDLSEYERDMLYERFECGRFSDE